SKACDEIMAVGIPAAAANLRRIVNLAQLLQSHALAFFYLSSPDLLLGMDGDPATRNLFGVLSENPNLARDGVALRKFGQSIIEHLGGKRIHPAWIVAGGVESPMSLETRTFILDGVGPAKAAVLRSLEWYKQAVDPLGHGPFAAEAESFGRFESLFMGMVDEDGNLEHYDGKLRVIDARGQVVDDFDIRRYRDKIDERVEPFSFLKSPYYRPLGYPAGMYRVGPLARLNIAKAAGTPMADRELEFFRQLADGPVLGSFHYHHARLIEMLHALERIEDLAADPVTGNHRVRAEAGPNRSSGIGAAEAPRGTLIHEYEVDDNGLVTAANMIIATGHNNLALNASVKQVAQRFVDGKKIQEGMLNRVEAVVRAYDPCLSCSTHAIGKMPLRVTLVSREGETLDEAVRD
ncbi:MAG TPA: Ni/Fe hydrogenase subunit alpha, partial [Deinococcales bacterium]|nr:Ni/Fe hydrogenase subunit alpha [Deinococcales bacterium]